MTSQTNRNNIRKSSSEASTWGAEEDVSSSSRASVTTVKENKAVSTLTGADTSIDVTIEEETMTRHRSSRQSIQVPPNEDSYFCRICHALGSKRRLLSPCLCRGSISLVHRRCLERWLAESDSNVCEICGFEYSVKRLPKYGLLGSLWTWVFSPRNGDKRKLLLLDFSTGVILLLITYVCSILGGRALGFEPPTKPGSNELILTRLIQSFIVCSVIVLNMGVVAWTIYRFQYHFYDWHAWYRRHCVVILQGYAGQEDQEQTTAGTMDNNLRINDSLAQAASSSSSISARDFLKDGSGPYSPP